jgi:DNA-binding IclR family transcriptional regulator
MSVDNRKAGMGEMRRRHEAIIRSGALAKLRSEGRLVFAIALCWADYRTCQFKMTARGAATVAGVQPTAIRRGLAQLVTAGILEQGPAVPGKRPRYRFLCPGSC